MLEERARQSLSSSTISCLSLISGELLCVCVCSCAGLPNICVGRQWGRLFSLTYLLLLISAAQREREKKKERLLFGTHHGDRDGAGGTVGVVVGGHQVAHVEGRLGHRVHFACEANKTRGSLAPNLQGARTQLTEDGAVLAAPGRRIAALRRKTALALLLWKKKRKCTTRHESRRFTTLSRPKYIYIISIRTHVKKTTRLIAFVNCSVDKLFVCQQIVAAVGAKTNYPATCNRISNRLDFVSRQKITLDPNSIAIL